LANRSFRTSRSGDDTGAGGSRARTGSRPAGRDLSRPRGSSPRGSTRPTLRQQLDEAPVARRRADPGTVRRFITMSALLAVMLVVLTPTLRSYLQQRSEIAELKREKVAGQQRVDALTAERKRWDDPAYVKQQAQERLGYAMPGKSITVYVDDAGATHATTPRNGVTDATGLSSHPWYGQIWGSISTPAEGEK